MLGLLSQPKVQNADDAVVTLCDRLANSLLLEDRKAAVLTLRGLSHENRELVASVGLKGLLNTLVKDSFDAAAAKATLETLLILFNTDTRRKVRNKRFISPLLKRDAGIHADESARVASDISLWLTDQLLHNDEALHQVLELATTKSDPFTAVYALQLVSVMTANRPQETKQTLLASGGVAQLVAALGSAQEMVRDEALLLVSALTADHLEMQKLVAFEGGFDYALQILLDSGGAVFGGRFAEDSLTLVANLIEFNTSNQKLFAQSGNIAQWTQILQSIVDSQNDDSTRVSIFYKEQVIANIQAALLIGQLLCLPDAELTKTNQDLLHDSGAFTLILQIALGPVSPPVVRVSALLTTAAIVNNNDSRQNDLLGMDVPYYELSPNTQTNPNGDVPIIPVAQALLNWCICLSSMHFFDLRAAAMICLRSAMNNNAEAKLAFANEQIEHYEKSNLSSVSGDPEKSNQPSLQFPNLISVLAEYSDETRLNPLRIWFAAAIVMHLFDGAPEVKERLRNVTIGDESLGMEIQSLVQALAGELQGALQTAETSSQITREPTVVIGYLQLLTVWLYDDIPAVNDFLEESTIVRSLLSQYQTANPLVSTISVVLLGVAYAFCTEKSPLSRIKFYEQLTQSLGRDQYLASIRKFKQSPAFFNFDETDMFASSKSASVHPVYLDATFIELMREGLTHISRVIDMDPHVEPSSKITFEMVDEAKQALFQKVKLLEATEAKLKDTLTAKEQLEQKLQDSLDQAKASTESNKNHVEQLSKTESEMKDIQSKATELEAELGSVKSEFKEQKIAFEKLQIDFKNLSTESAATKAAKEKAETGINNMTREIFQLQRQKESLEKENSKAQSELSKLKPKLESTLESEVKLKEQLKELRSKHSAEAQSSSKLKDTNDKLVAKLKETATFLTVREQEEEELKSELSAVKIKAESQENEYRSLKNREAMTRKQLDAAKSDYEATSRQLKAATDALEEAQKKIEKLEIDLNSKLGAETQDIKAKLLESETANKKLRQSAKDSDVKINELSTGIDTFKDEIATLKSKIEKLTQEASQFEEERSTLVNQKEKLHTEKLELTKENSELINGKKTLGTENSKLSEANASLTEENKKLQHLVEQSKTNGNTDNEHSKLVKNNENLKQVNLKLMQELATYKKAQGSETSSSTSAESQTKITELQSQLQEKQNDLDELMVLLEDLSDKKSSYKNRLRQMEGESVSDSDEDDDDDDE